MTSIITCERDWGGVRVIVHVIDGLDHAGAVRLGGEIIVGRGRTDAETEGRIRRALAEWSAEATEKAS